MQSAECYNPEGENTLKESPSATTPRRVFRDRVRNALLSLGIRARIRVALIVVAVLPFLIFGAVMYQRTSRDVLLKTESASLQTVRSVSSGYGAIVERFSQQFRQLMFSPEMQTLLAAYNSTEQEAEVIVAGSIEALLSAFLAVERSVHSIVILPEASGTPVLASKLDRPAEFTGSLQRLRGDYESFRIHQAAIREGGRAVWMLESQMRLAGEEEASIGVSFPVRSLTSMATYGVVVFLMYRDVFDSLYYPGGGDEALIVVQPDGHLVSEVGTLPSSGGEIRPGMLGILDSADEYGSFRSSLGRDSYVVSYARVPANQWVIAEVVPYYTVVRETRQTAAILLILAAIIMLVAGVAAFLIAKTISNPLDAVARAMRRVELGDLSTRLPQVFRDEFSVIERGFNRMISRIVRLMDQRTEQERRDREMRIRLLQAQMNPHFIYNTLDSIQWMASIVRAEDIGEMTRSLADYLRLSLNQGEDLTTLGNEVACALNYTRIQNLRFAQRLTLSHNVTGQLLDYRIPKLLIVPLVENSIQHGLDGNAVELRIQIGAETTADEIRIGVRDNGVGMEPARVESCLDRNPDDDRSGFALPNIQERIKLQYGSRFGLKIDSRPGVGTTVMIVLPREANA